MMSDVQVPEKWNQPVPFDPQLFVDREEEKELFFEHVRATHQHKYLEFTGIAGQGKSELLKWIYHNGRQGNYIAAYIDFELPTYQRPEFYPILETIVNHFEAQAASDDFAAFKEQLTVYLEKLREYYLASWSNLESADRSSFVGKLEVSLIDAFKQGLSALPTSHKVVLCLDSTEKAYLGTLYSFEEQILKAYTAHANFMLVTAGQTKMTWKTKEITERVMQHKLSSLDSEGVFHQVQGLAKKKRIVTEDAEVISDKMLQLTLGHPFSNYKLVDFWTNGFTLPLNERVVEEQFGQGIRELVDQVIETRVLRKLQLSQKYPPVSEILWYLAALRHIEVGTLWYMLPLFLKTRIKKKSFEYFETLIDKFKDAYIFIRCQFGTGYDMEPVVRNILLWDMRINAHDEFLTIQKTLMDQYHELVSKQSQDPSRIENIVERLYHYAQYLKESQSNNVLETLQEELRHYLGLCFTSHDIHENVIARNQLNRLQNCLENDNELATITNVSVLVDVVREFKRLGDTIK